MKLFMHVLAGVVALGGVRHAAGDERPLRTAESKNGRYELRIRAGRPDSGALGGCRATLFDHSAADQGRRQCWERFLVNDVAPEVALIRDDGRFTVTLGDFRRGGGRHALVVYGAQGQLLRHFLLPDLLEREDWRHVSVQKQSVQWLDGAKFQFVQSPPEFVITLRHGRRIRLDLKTLSVVRGDGAQARADSDAVPPEVLAALFGTPEAETAGAPEESDAPAPAPVEPGEMGPDVPEQPTAEVVTEPVESSHRQNGTEGDPAAVEGATPDLAVAEPSPGDAARPAEAGSSNETAEAPAPDPGSLGGLAVPPPDPAHPVDYLALVNQFVPTEGPSAGPHFEAAIAGLVGWQGDDAQYRAAERGDVEALLSPTVQEWLDKNQAAIAAFRDGSRLEFHGWELHSSDGSMLAALLPSLAPLRQLAKATVMDGRRLEAQGAAAPASANYVDTLAAGARISGGPTLIESLVGIAVQSLASRALLDLPAGGAADRLDYEDLAGRLAVSSEPTRPFAECLQMERMACLDTLQRLYVPDPAGGGYVADPENAGQLRDALGASASATDERWLRVSTDEFQQMVRDANVFYDTARDAVSRPFVEGQPVMRELEGRFTNDQATNPLMKALVPSFARAYFLKTRSESARRAASLVTNVMAYRQQYGEYPESLQAFGGHDFGTDPFTGQAFRYRREGDSFVLYSAGANGADDGGVHDPKGETSDIVYWPRPPKP